MKHVLWLLYIKQGGGKFEFEGETFIPGDVIINPNRGGGSMMILSEIREERPLSFLPAIKVPFGLVAYVPSNDEGDRVFVRLTPEAGIGGMKGFRKATEEEKAKMLAAMKEEKHYSFNFEKLQPEYGGGEKLHSPSHSSPKGNELPRIS